MCTNSHTTLIPSYLVSWLLWKPSAIYMGFYTIYIVLVTTGHNHFELYCETTLKKQVAHKELDRELGILNILCNVFPMTLKGHVQ